MTPGLEENSRHVLDWGMLRSEQVDYIEHDGCRLTFFASRDPGEGERRVRMGTQSLRVRVESTREAGGGFVCHGAVQGEWKLPEAVAGAEVRGARRIPCRIRVMGRELPAFRGMTVDFSVSGMQVELEGPVEVGQVLDVRLDFELPTLESVECCARVAWCRQEHARSYRAGMEFLNAADSTRVALKGFEGWLLDPSQRPRAPQAPPARPPAEPPVRPPAGHLEGFVADETEVRLVVVHRQGGRHRLRFSRPRVVRDNRGMTGASYVDAVEFEASELIAAVWRRGPIKLDDPPDLRHYQFLSQTDEVVFEIVCEGPSRCEESPRRPRRPGHG